MNNEHPNTAALEAYMEWRKPIYHIPVNLGINKFKKEARASGLTKSYINRLIKAYRKRSWMEYKGVARYRGSFPVHPVYGTKLAVTGAMDEESAEYTIKVGKDGKTKN